MLTMTQYLKLDTFLQDLGFGREEDADRPDQVDYRRTVDIGSSSFAEDLVTAHVIVTDRFTSLTITRENEEPRELGWDTSTTARARDMVTWLPIRMHAVLGIGEPARTI